MGWETPDNIPWWLMLPIATALWTAYIVMVRKGKKNGQR